MGHVIFIFSLKSTYACHMHDIGQLYLSELHVLTVLYLSELHVLTRSGHFISLYSTVPVFTATGFRLASGERTVLSGLSIFMDYTYRENVGVITLTWLRMIMIHVLNNKLNA